MMNIRVSLISLVIVACGSSTPTTGPGNVASGGAAGFGTVAGSSGAGGTFAAAGSAATAGQSGSSELGGTFASAGVSGGGAAGAGAGASTGGAGGMSGGGAGGASGGGAGGAGGASGGSVGAGGGMMIPTGYTGTPFKAMTIPGFIYAANYDNGGPGVGFCHSAGVTTAAECANGIKLNDWCCGNMARCDQRNQPALCPVYRQDADNAGLSHLNLPEPDNWAVSGPTWMDGANGPTLSGPAATVKTPVPEHANTTTETDTYISYMHTGQWTQYTVQVMAAGTYSIGGVVAAPGGVTIQFDFGTGVTSGVVTVPASPTPETEAYHEWNIVSNIGQVTFAAPGTYLMRFSLLTQQFNPLFFTFTKM